MKKHMKNLEFICENIQYTFEKTLLKTQQNIHKDKLWKLYHKLFCRLDPEVEMEGVKNCEQKIHQQKLMECHKYLKLYLNCSPFPLKIL